ncbi:hypothetical protein KM295_12155 [Natronomonas sp. F2-12]|uniref:Uncharacterized protein n=1 Tax=Natronomonas aquatica TaxID=2841590 RepID=A0A9R1CVD1_9EURY|nr:hypothetical protein [Natronomonas aquatica]MCQ4334216.1 hypothetical protein [Natronomonas aquatica]
MRAARFVTLCFIYSGLVFLAQYVTIYGVSFELAGLAQLGVGLSILGAGLLRLKRPEEEAQNPAEYGLFTYGMTALSLFITVIFLGQLLLL